KSTWKLNGTDSDKIWARVRDANDNSEWAALDFGAKSDTSLESADIQVSPNGNFIFTFEHAFSYETTPAAGGNPATYWDGSVIEITSDGGATWQDVSMFTNPGYGGTIGDGAAGATNPLEGRQGYVGKNAGYPAKSTVVLNFGSAFKGKTVKVRFR